MLTGVGRTETCTFFHNVESAGRDAVETCVVVIYAHPPGRDADKHVASQLSPSRGRRKAYSCFDSSQLIIPTRAEILHPEMNHKAVHFILYGVILFRLRSSQDSQIFNEGGLGHPLEDLLQRQSAAEHTIMKPFAFQTLLHPTSLK